MKVKKEVESLEKLLRNSLNPELVHDVEIANNEVRLLIATPVKLGELYNLVAATKALLNLRGYIAYNARVDGDEVFLVLRVERRQARYHT